MLDSLFILVQMISLTVLLTWALRQDADGTDTRKKRRRR